MVNNNVAYQKQFEPWIYDVVELDSPPIHFTQAFFAGIDGIPRAGRNRLFAFAFLAFQASYNQKKKKQ